MNTIEIERIFSASVFSEIDGGNITTEDSGDGDLYPEFPDENEIASISDEATANVVEYLLTSTD